MSIFGLPLILFKVEDEDDMNEIEYLARVAKGDLPTGELVTIINSASASSVVGTVPTGKDWYLINWSSTLLVGGNVRLELEYPTGTSVDGSTSSVDNGSQYNGIVRGLKLTAGQTVTVFKNGNVGNNTNVFILQVDTGASITIP